MKRGAFVAVGIAAFLLSFGFGAASKLVKSPAMQKYSVKWSDDLGTRKTDLAYGDGEAEKFDLYLPRDDTKASYGLAVYLHAGGFTSGDKSEDEEMLSWLCSKEYVAAGINYTLADEKSHASVLTQSDEIRDAMPKVVEAAKEAGYPVDKMTIAGGSAGHALAMIYAYRDGAGSAGPGCTDVWCSRSLQFLCGGLGHLRSRNGNRAAERGRCSTVQCDERRSHHGG